MSEKDFNLKITVRNARILSRIRKTHDTVVSFCRDHDLHYQMINSYITMKRSPMNKNDWSPVAVDLATALRVEPEVLWPDHMKRLLAKRSSVEVEMDAVDLAAIGDLEKATAQRQMIEKLTEVLTDRSLEVIQMRYLGDANLEDVAKEMGLSKERVRQIEKDAVRQMRRKAWKLKEFGVTEGLIE